MVNVCTGVNIKATIMGLIHIIIIFWLLWYAPLQSYYHIYHYRLIAGASEEMKKQISLKSIGDYKVTLRGISS